MATGSTGKDFSRSATLFGDTGVFLPVYSVLPPCGFARGGQQTCALAMFPTFPAHKLEIDSLVFLCYDGFICGQEV